MKTNIGELVDLKKVDALLEGFNKSTGFVTAILDLEGNVLSKSGWRQICTEFHRVHPKTSKRCTYSDTVLAGKMEKGEKYHAYTCSNGLIDVAVPLVIAGKHVANLFSGQFFFEEPDINFFKKQAKEFGFNEKEYLKALRKVPVVSEEKVKRSMDFLLQMTDLISELGVEKAEQVELNERLRENKKELQITNQHLDAQNQQLQATEQQLRAGNQQLIVSEERYKRAQIIGNIGNWEYNLKTGHFWGSEQGKRIYGFDPEYDDFTAEQVYKHVLDRPKVEQAMIDLIEKNKKYDIEFEITPKGGTENKIIHSIAELERDKQGNPVKVVGVLHDITEQKKATYKVRKQQKLLQNAEQLSNMGSWDWDAENDETYWSDGLFKIFKLDPEKGAPKWSQQKGFYDKESYEELNKAIEACIKFGTPYEVTVKAICSDGEIRTCVSRGRGEMNHEGKTTLLWGSFQDITERKKAEQVLKQKTKESEQQSIFINVLLDNLKVGVVACDADGKLTYFNKTTQKFHGLPQVEISADKWAEYYDLYYPDGKTKMQTEDIPLFKALEGEQFNNIEMMIRPKQGKSYSLVASGSTIFDADGKKQGAVVSMYDITERKQAEEAIKESEEKFNLIVDESPFPVAMADLGNEKIHYWSQNAKNMFGHTPATVSEWYKLAYPDSEYRKHAIKRWKPFLENTQKADTAINTGEYRITCKDQSIKICEIYAQYIHHNVVVTFNDITQRKKAEKQMRFLSTITENMHEAIVATDIEGHITYINKSAEKLFGYTLDELAGKHTDHFVIDPRAEEIQKELFETVAKGEIYQGEILDQRKDGSEFICEITVAPLTDENGVISSYIGIQRDITEIRNLEKAAIRQERLSAIGELASGVAHDFNNALQIILGGVEMALTSEEPEELNQYLESIKQSAGDAASRVRQLQRFSQKSQVQKESVPIKINNLIDDVIKETKLLLNQYQEKGIHIEIKSDYQAKSNIEGDEGELRACLFNLTKNSAEAMPEGGEITICTDEHDGNVYVNVSDTGTGMDKETQKKIFQPFYSTKGFEPGRGLGMAQVYSTIRDHNGDIYIKASEMGKGTVIEFAIPVSKEELILEQKEEDYVGTASILWVDDEEMIRRFGKKMLKMLGHTGDFAANGKEALEFLAKGNKYDLIITDIGMPGMSGWQLAEEIKNKGYATRIAVVTGWGAEISQEDKNRYNVGYVLGKPVELKDLKALIGEVLQMKNISHNEHDDE